MPRFRLRQGSHELELPLGPFFIGRGTECQLTLDDPLVSRRHAVLHVAEHEVVLEDLGSRNGIMLNGERRTGRVALRPGDVFMIGGQELLLALASPARRPTEAGFTQPISLDLLGAAVSPDPPMREPETRHASAFALLLGVAAKALALGKLEDADRILSNLAATADEQLRSGALTGDNFLELDDAAEFAVNLAMLTGKPRWVDWTFDTYRRTRRVLTAALIDELHAFVRRTRYPATQPLRAYVQMLRERGDALGPSERFLRSRVEGLLEVASAN